jgi:hypothetical protein
MDTPAAGLELIARLQAYRDRLRKSGRLLEVRAVEHCIELARTDCRAIPGRPKGPDFAPPASSPAGHFSLEQPPANPHGCALRN